MRELRDLQSGNLRLRPGPDARGWQVRVHLDLVLVGLLQDWLFRRTGMRSVFQPELEQLRHARGDLFVVLLPVYVREQRLHLV